MSEARDDKQHGRRERWTEKMNEWEDLDRSTDLFIIHTVLWIIEW